MEFLQEELDEILNIFAQEGAEILQSMDKNLLLLEKKPNNLDIAMQLYREAHSLKGSARMLGFEGIQNIAHKIEDVLGLIREGKITVNSNITDTISAALSLIDILIKKTVEQKSEYISEKSELHIQKLKEICEGTAETNQSVEVEEKKDFLKENFEKFEGLIVELIQVYSKSVRGNNPQTTERIAELSLELSSMCFELEDKELYNLSVLIEKEAKKINTGSLKEETFRELNKKINDFVQEFTKVAKSKNLKTKNYFENAYQFSYDIKQQEVKADTELKEAELLELINKSIETVPEINKNRHSLAEAKSLLNEIISRLNHDDFKKVYQTILAIVVNFEKSNLKLEPDAIDAVREILETTANIVEARASKKVYNDFLEEIELLNQKAVIISQMIKYELENPNKRLSRQKSAKPVEWAQSFDTTSIKTLRVNSDKLDKLVNQIGNLIVTRIKSYENVGLVRAIQHDLIELQKYYHKVGYYMKFYEKKYVQENLSDNPQIFQKKDIFTGYNKQLLSFHNASTERMNSILNNINFLLKELQENNIKLNTTTSEIENIVKSMRILPLSTVLNLFPRMVHNIAKDKGKEIEFTIEGGEVSADKKIIEDVKIPIMHIVRNSIDHGIEMPNDRERAGKKRTGLITIKASQKASKIVISIKDDGRGINIEKIRQKAIEKGFITQEAADNMPKEQLANFIFYPGFSTGDTVTELSGRGLGLDIVHTKISQLNGRIDVYSEENKGTVVTMELPTTMATMKAFIIMENNHLFAIPASSIQTVLRVSPEDIKHKEGKYYYIYDNEAISICSLSSILNIKEEVDPVNEKHTMVVIKSESVTTGIIVQRLIGDEEILNKKLPEPMLRVKNISGITTLANGEMCLLLNVSEILSSNKINPHKLNTTKSLRLQDNSKYKILVVDDSITTRRLLGNILSSNGYTAEVEPSAKNALRDLDTDFYDLIITDYEMPEMDGLQFVKIVRSKQRTKNIPIIVVTSIEKPNLLDEFFQYNIQNFIRKGHFEQRAFIKAVEKCLKP